MAIEPTYGSVPIHSHIIYPTRGSYTPPPPPPSRPGPWVGHYVTAPVQHYGTFHAGIPTQHPFHAALQQAHQNVVRAQAHLPRQPTPYIPRLANPTPAQARAALTIARNAQSQAVGPNPSMARIRQYQRELANDPRQ